MRRRRVRDRDWAAVPEELVEFDAAAWDGRGGAHGWIAARRAWAARNRWPGDPVEFIREHADAKRGRAATWPAVS